MGNCCSQAPKRRKNRETRRNSKDRSDETDSDSGSDGFTNMVEDGTTPKPSNGLSSPPPENASRGGKEANPLSAKAAARKRRKEASQDTRSAKAHGGEASAHSEESDLSWGEQQVTDNRDVNAGEAAIKAPDPKQESRYDTSQPQVGMSRSNSTFSGSSMSSRRSTIFEQLQLASMQGSVREPGVDVRSSYAGSAINMSASRTRNSEHEFLSENIGGGGAGSAERQRFIDESSAILVQYSFKDVYDGPERHVYSLMPLDQQASTDLNTSSGGLWVPSQSGNQ